MAQSAVQAPSDQHRTTRQLVYFEEIGLLVKYGIEPKVNIAEGQCHWALRQQVPGIPVPEIYGWLKDGDLTFLFLEPVHGITLEKIWTSLSRPERTEICTQLRSMLKELRDLRQDPGQQFIGITPVCQTFIFVLTPVGDISRGPLADIVFTNGNLPRGGPFADVKEFHDWLSSMLTRGK